GRALPHDTRTHPRPRGAHHSRHARARRGGRRGAARHRPAHSRIPRRRVRDVRGARRPARRGARPAGARAAWLRSAVRVLYVSKALTVAAYRDKVKSLAELVDVTAVMPDRWGVDGVEPTVNGAPRVVAWPVRAHGKNHFHTYRGARRMVTQARSDLVHIDEEPYSAATFQLARHCVRTHTPFIFFAWQNLHKRIPPPFGAMRSYVFRRAAGAIAGTEAAADVLRAHGWSGPTAVIPQLGVDTTRFRPDPAARMGLHRRLGASDDEVFVGFGGRLVPEKGVVLLVRAIAGVPGTRLIVLGDGPERERLESLAESLGIAERV